MKRPIENVSGQCADFRIQIVALRAALIELVNAIQPDNMPDYELEEWAQGPIHKARKALEL